MNSNSNIWILTRRTYKTLDGKMLGMYDSETGGIRHGEVIGYRKSYNEISKLHKYYQRFGSRFYKYRIQLVKFLDIKK